VGTDDRTATASLPTHLASRYTPCLVNLVPLPSTKEYGSIHKTRQRLCRGVLLLDLTTTILTRTCAFLLRDSSLSSRTEIARHAPSSVRRITTWGFSKRRAAIHVGIQLRNTKVQEGCLPALPSRYHKVLARCKVRHTTPRRNPSWACR